MGHRILIIEDEVTIAESLVFRCQSEGFEVTHRGDAGSGFSTIASFNPHLIVLDVGLPDRSGFDLCRDIRAISQVPILFLTARSDEVDRIVGLELGGDDYVTKPFSIREVVSRIRAILRRTSGEETSVAAPNPSQITSRPINHPELILDRTRARILYQEVPLELTRCEFKLLAALMERPGWVLSREQLMAIAWESPDMSLERTVDTHIKTVRAKLKRVDPTKDLIITHRGFGYSLREDR